MATRPVGRLGIAALLFGALLIVGGELGGGGFGALAVGYGVLIVLSGLFIVAGLGLRHVLARGHHSPAEATRATHKRAESLR